MSARTFDINKPKAYGNVRVDLMPDGETVKVTLHSTVVVTWHKPTNTAVLDSGGYYTATTKTAMNTALEQIYGKAFKVGQSKGDWYLKIETRSSDIMERYQDRMKLSIDINGLATATFFN